MHEPSETKPKILRRPGRLGRLLLILLAMFILIYVATAATGFIRAQKDSPPPRDDDRPTATAPLNGDRM